MIAKRKKKSWRNGAQSSEGVEEVLNRRLFLSHNVSILKFNTWLGAGKIPWLMMFDVDLQITFFKLLRAKQD